MRRKQRELQQAQADALEEQRRARLAALNLMEDAVATRERAEAANAALRKHEALLERIIETMAEGLVMIDADGRYTLVNAAGEDILDWKSTRLNSSH